MRSSVKNKIIWTYIFLLSANFNNIKVNPDKTEILTQIYYYFKWKAFGKQVKPSCKILKNY